MKIHAFDQPCGFFHFELTDLHTAFHQHPTIELIAAQSGTFNLNTSTRQLTNLTFAIIDKNVPHQVTAEQSALTLCMYELPNTVLYQTLAALNIQFTNGIFSNTQHIDYQNIITTFKNTTPTLADEPRVQICLDFFQAAEVNYQTMLADLCQRVHLSESRLSHLFKADTGISIKQYAVWNRLKKTILQMMQQEIPLSAAALQCGFYDAAHWNNAFKKYLGISPASVY
ncbi:MAG: helix-turn-helix domain-containing protein [Saprospiraceae bacterium]